MSTLDQRPPEAPSEMSGGEGVGLVAPDRPHRRIRVSVAGATELAGSGVSAFLFVWLIFTVTATSAPFGLLVSWLLAFFTFYGVLTWQLHGVLQMKDLLARLAIWTFALVAMVPLAAVIFYVVYKGAAVVFVNFPSFLVKDMTQLGGTGTSAIGSVGVGAAIVGTVEQVGLATLLTVPLGVLAATHLVDSRTPFSKFVIYVVDAMTGMPAIIAGLFVYLLWVAPHHESGKSGFAAALALSVIMLPIVTRAAMEVLIIVPGSLREASLALGAPQWRVILRVVLPTARAGLITAVILGIARVAGETAPVLFTAGGNNRYNWNPFVGQQDDLPLRVYSLIFQSSAVAVRLAWGVSFVLVVVVLLLFVLARLAGGGRPGRRYLPWPARSKTQGES